MKFTKLFFDTVKPERVKMAICMKYNERFAVNPSDELTFSTFTRWINSKHDNLTKKAVMDTITDVTGLTEDQILEPQTAQA